MNPVLPEGLMTKVQADLYTSKCEAILGRARCRTLAEGSTSLAEQGFVIIKGCIPTSTARKAEEAAKKQYSQLEEMDQITGVVDEEPYEDAMQNSKHAAENSLREQCFMKEEPALEDVTKALKSKMLSEQMPEANYVWSQARVLRSLPLNDRQMWHQDDKDKPESLTALVALSIDGANYGVIAGSHAPGSSKESCTPVNVTLECGDALIFMLNTVHQGGCYAEMNMRFHHYCFHKNNVPCPLPADTRPNVVAGIFNGEKEERCDHDAMRMTSARHKLGRPQPFSVMRRGEDSEEGSKRPTLPQDLLEIKSSSHEGYLPFYSVVPAVDGRNPVAKHVVSIMKSIQTIGFRGDGFPIIAVPIHEQDRMAGQVSWYDPQGKTFDGYHRLFAEKMTGLQCVPLLWLPFPLTRGECAILSWKVHRTIVLGRRPTHTDAIRAVFEACKTFDRVSRVPVALEHELLNNGVKKNNLKNFVKPVVHILFQRGYKKADPLAPSIRRAIQNLFTIGGQFDEGVADKVLSMENVHKHVKMLEDAISKMVDPDAKFGYTFPALVAYFEELLANPERHGDARHPNKFVEHLRVNYDINLVPDATRREVVRRPSRGRPAPRPSDTAQPSTQKRPRRGEVGQHRVQAQAQVSCAHEDSTPASDSSLAGEAAKQVEAESPFAVAGSASSKRDGQRSQPRIDQTPAREESASPSDACLAGVAAKEDKAASSLAADAGTAATPGRPATARSKKDIVVKGMHAEGKRNLVTSEDLTPGRKMKIKARYPFCVADSSKPVILVTGRFIAQGTDDEILPSGAGIYEVIGLDPMIENQRIFFQVDECCMKVINEKNMRLVLNVDVTECQGHDPSTKWNLLCTLGSILFEC